jgi:hypothetical protein
MNPDSFGPLILLPIICFIIYYILKKQGALNKDKKLLLILFAISFFLTEAGRAFYRPEIYERGIFDLYIADTLGTSFGTLTAIFFVLLLQGKKRISDMFYIIGVTVIIMIYEILRLPGNEVYDVRDLFAALICGTAAGVFYWLHFIWLPFKRAKKADSA